MTQVEMYRTLAGAHALELRGRLRTREQWNALPHGPTQERGRVASTCLHASPRAGVQIRDAPVRVEQHERVAEPLHEHELEG
jgi:hypothetical protein